VEEVVNVEIVGLKRYSKVQGWKKERLALRKHRSIRVMVEHSRRKVYVVEP